jgi:hypothetical protein
MLNRRTLLATLPAAALAQQRKFARSFFYLKPDSRVLLVDFAIGSDLRAWALGATVGETSRAKGAMVFTSDGAKTWQTIEIKFLPRSIFALDDSFLWAVGDKGEIWYSAEGGRDWKKISKQENALRVHFLDNQRGFLVGRKKTFMRTDDGGRTWRHVPEAAQVGGNADTMVYRWVSFWNGKIGLAGGASEPPPRRGRVVLPDWMEPEIATYRNNRPRVMISLESKDAGATWAKQELSGFGYVHRSVIGSDGTGLTLVKFDKSFTFGGELYAFYPKFNKPAQLVVRWKDLELQDVLYVPGDGTYLAATERYGTLPVPTKVRIRYSKDLVTWVELRVDYRAVAERITLGATPSGKVFAALDQGTILALQ